MDSSPRKSVHGTPAWLSVSGVWCGDQAGIASCASGELARQQGKWQWGRHEGSLSHGGDAATLHKLASSGLVNSIFSLQALGK